MSLIDIDVKLPLDTPDGVVRRIVLTVNPVNFKKIRARVEEDGDKGCTKTLGACAVDLAAFQGLGKLGGGG
jgi:hypothetical protein